MQFTRPESPDAASRSELVGVGGHQKLLLTAIALEARYELPSTVTWTGILLSQQIALIEDVRIRVFSAGDGRSHETLRFPVLTLSIYQVTRFEAMPHTIKDKKQLLTRAHRLQGQAAALEKALEKGDECVAIFQHVAAIRGAANGLMAQVPGR